MSDDSDSSSTDSEYSDWKAFRKQRRRHHNKKRKQHPRQTGEIDPVLDPGFGDPSFSAYHQGQSRWAGITRDLQTNSETSFLVGDNPDWSVDEDQDNTPRVDPYETYLPQWEYRTVPQVDPKTGKFTGRSTTEKVDVSDASGVRHYRGSDGIRRSKFWNPGSQTWESSDIPEALPNEDTNPMYSSAEEANEAFRNHSRIRRGRFYGNPDLWDSEQREKNQDTQGYKKDIHTDVDWSAYLDATAERDAMGGPSHPVARYIMEEKAKALFYDRQTQVAADEVVITKGEDSKTISLYPAPPPVEHGPMGSFVPYGPGEGGILRDNPLITDTMRMEPRKGAFATLGDQGTRAGLIMGEPLNRQVREDYSKEGMQMARTLDLHREALASAARGGKDGAEEDGKMRKDAVWQEVSPSGVRYELQGRKMVPIPNARQLDMSKKVDHVLGLYQGDEVSQEMAAAKDRTSRALNTKSMAVVKPTQKLMPMTLLKAFGSTADGAPGQALMSGATATVLAEQRKNIVEEKRFTGYLSKYQVAGHASATGAATPAGTVVPLTVTDGMHFARLRAQPDKAKTQELEDGKPAFSKRLATWVTVPSQKSPAQFQAQLNAVVSSNLARGNENVDAFLTQHQRDRNQRVFLPEPALALPHTGGFSTAVDGQVASPGALQTLENKKQGPESRQWQQWDAVISAEDKRERDRRESVGLDTAGSAWVRAAARQKSELAANMQHRVPSMTSLNDMRPLYPGAYTAGVSPLKFPEASMATQQWETMEEKGLVGSVQGKHRVLPPQLRDVVGDVVQEATRGTGMATLTVEKERKDILMGKDENIGYHARRPEHMHGLGIATHPVGAFEQRGDAWSTGDANGDMFVTAENAPPTSVVFDPYVEGRILTDQNRLKSSNAVTLDMLPSLPSMDTSSLPGTIRPLPHVSVRDDLNKKKQELRHTMTLLEQMHVGESLATALDHGKSIQQEFPDPKKNGARVRTKEEVEWVRENMADQANVSTSHNRFLRGEQQQQVAAATGGLFKHGPTPWKTSPSMLGAKNRTPLSQETLDTLLQKDPLRSGNTAADNLLSPRSNVLQEFSF